MTDLILTFHRVNSHFWESFNSKLLQLYFLRLPKRANLVTWRDLLFKLVACWLFKLNAIILWVEVEKNQVKKKPPTVALLSKRKKSESRQNVRTSKGLVHQLKKWFKIPYFELHSIDSMSQKAIYQKSQFSCLYFSRSINAS